MDGLKGTLESHRLPQFLQGEIVLFGQQRTHLAAVDGNNHRLAPGITMPGRNVTRPPPLLQELLDHAQGNPKTPGNLRAGALSVVVRRKDSFTEIQR